MGGASAYNPEDAVGGVDKEQLALLVEQAVFVVREVIAEKLGAVLHAERLETVALTPVAQSKGKGESVGIEEGLVGRELSRVGSKSGVVEVFNSQGGI